MAGEPKRREEGREGGEEGGPGTFLTHHHTRSYRGQINATIFQYVSATAQLLTTVIQNGIGHIGITNYKQGNNIVIIIIIIIIISCCCSSSSIVYCIQLLYSC